MRSCGVCKLGLRDGTAPEPLRVGEEGADAKVLNELKVAGTVAPGLYAACPDCVHVLKPFVAQRVHKQRVREERIAAVTEDREQRPVPAVDVADLTANDLC